MLADTLGLFPGSRICSLALWGRFPDRGFARWHSGAVSRIADLLADTLGPFPESRILFLHSLASQTGISPEPQDGANTPNDSLTKRNGFLHKITQCYDFFFVPLHADLLPLL